MRNMTFDRYQWIFNSCLSCYLVKSKISQTVKWKKPKKKKKITKSENLFKEHFTTNFTAEDLQDKGSLVGVWEFICSCIFFKKTK